MFSKNLGYSIHLRLSPSSADFFLAECDRLKISLPDLIRAILAAYMAENGGFFNEDTKVD